MTAVIIGENANKQTEYKATKNTKVYQIEDSSNYNFDQLNTQISEYIYSTVKKEINNVVINGLFTEQAKELFNMEISSQPNLGTAAFIGDKQGYKVTIPQITNNKVSFKIKFTLNNEIDRTYINQTVKIINSATINYDDKRQESKTLTNNEKSPTISFLERYTLEITTINKEFQEILVSDVNCTVVQKNETGDIIQTFENLRTDSNGKITIDTLTYVPKSSFEVQFNSTPGPYEDKDNENLSINKDLTSGIITVTTSSLEAKDGESIEVDNYNKIIKAKFTIAPKCNSI